MSNTIKEVFHHIDIIKKFSMRDKAVLKMKTRLVDDLNTHMSHTNIPWANMDEAVKLIQAQAADEFNAADPLMKDAKKLQDSATQVIDVFTAQFKVMARHYVELLEYCSGFVEKDAMGLQGFKKDVYKQLFLELQRKSSVNMDWVWRKVKMKYPEQRKVVEVMEEDFYDMFRKDGDASMEEGRLPEEEDDEEGEEEAGAEGEEGDDDSG